MPKYPNLTVELAGNDGNAFAILGRVAGALRKHLRNEVGLTTAAVDATIKEFQEEATSGDYDHLLRTVMDWVDVA